RNCSRPAADRTHVTTYVPIVVMLKTSESARNAAIPSGAAARNVGTTSILGDEPRISMSAVRVGNTLADGTASTVAVSSRIAPIVLHSPNAMSAQPAARLIACP